MGEGTVVNFDLSGKEINSFVVSDNKRSLSYSKSIKLTDDEAKKIQNDCLVIQPDEQIQTEEITSVEF